MTRNKQLKRVSRGAVLLLLAATAAHNIAEAAEADVATPGPYVTASVVESSMELRGIGAVSDRSPIPGFGDERSTGWSVGGGYRFSRYLAFEVGHLELGEKTFVARESPPVTLSSSNTLHVDLIHTRVASKGDYLAFAGSFPIKDHWEPYARVGAFRAETTATTRIRVVPHSSPTPPPPRDADYSPLSDNSTETMFALGVRYKVGTHNAIVLEAMAIPDLGSEEVTDEGDLKSLTLGFQYRF